MTSLRDCRLRHFFGARYDYRKNLVDWDYMNKLKKVASIVHYRQYRRVQEACTHDHLRPHRTAPRTSGAVCLTLGTSIAPRGRPASQVPGDVTHDPLPRGNCRSWRLDGIAYEFGDQQYDQPNRTMITYAEGMITKGQDRGAKKEIRWLVGCLGRPGRRGQLLPHASPAMLTSSLLVPRWESAVGVHGHGTWGVVPDCQGGFEAVISHVMAGGKIPWLDHPRFGSRHRSP